MTTSTLKKLILFSAFNFFLLSFPASSQAATINAQSCLRADVQAAINQSQDGDDVNVPAGTCTWTSLVTISGKGIALRGAGAGRTTIVNGSNGTALSIDFDPGDPTIYITGFTFDANNRDTGSDPMINLSANGNNLSAFRIHHFELLNQFERGIAVSMDGFEVGGLIDHGYIESRGSKWISILGTGAQEHQPFSRPLALGTNKFIFIEDNTIVNTNTSAQIDGFLDAYAGARYVFRHNTMIGCPAESGHHGADSGGYRGTHSFEYYNNTFTVTKSCSYTTRALNFRSGTGVVYNNTWSSGYTTMSITNYRSDGSYSPWGQCNGSSPWDENTPGENGWACLDQIGHTFGPTSGGANVLEPLYEWNNTINGNDADFDATNHNADIHVKANRDYYNDTVRPGYVAYAYPHPSQGSAPPPDTTPPSPPAGLTVQ